MECEKIRTRAEAMATFMKALPPGSKVILNGDGGAMVQNVLGITYK